MYFLTASTLANYCCWLVALDGARLRIRPAFAFQQPHHNLCEIKTRSKMTSQFFVPPLKSSSSSPPPHLMYSHGTKSRRTLFQLLLAQYIDRNSDTEPEDNEQELLASLDKAPCFDNGVCLSFPDEEDQTWTVKGGVISDSNENTNGINSNHSRPLLVTSSSGGAIQRLGGTTTGPTVWSEFGRLAAEYSQNNDNFSNLGQGFPDWLPPEFAIQSLVSAALDTSSSSSPHQYTRTAGHPNLVKQLATRYSKHLDRNVDPMTEVAVTVGASQALYLCLQTLVRPGDEVILFEPFFDLYVNQIKLAGGTPVYVPLTFVPYRDDGSGSGSSSQEDDDIRDSGNNNDNLQKPKVGREKGGRWILEPNKLREKVSATKTRAIILNSPHNPTGKVFTHSEMLDIANVVTDIAGPQCIVLSDEVYKYIVHSPPRDDVRIGNNLASELSSVQEDRSHCSTASVSSNQRKTSSCPGHVHFASLPNMWERTLTISSAGKTFSATGWQVGWCIGPTHLISPIHQLLPYVQFCASTVIQEALARTLPRADEEYEGYASYYEYLNEKYRRKRDLLSKALKDVGFTVPDYDATPGWGGFFIFAQITPEVRKALPSFRLQKPYCANPAAPGGVARLDWALCQWMVEELGVLCIPSSPFFSKERAVEGASDEFIRVAFCKTDETIERAAFSLGKLALIARDNTDISDDVVGNENTEVKGVAVAAVG